MISISTILLLVAIAAACAGFGQTMSGKVPGGILVSIGVGFVGALLGPGLARWLEFPQPFMVEIDGQPFSIVWTVIGAAVFVTILQLFSKRY